MAEKTKKKRPASDPNSAKFKLGKLAADAYADAVAAKERREMVGWCASNFPVEIPETLGLLVCYPQNRKPVYGIKFIKNGYERVINDLTIATHGHYSDFALQNSNAIYNEHNAVMREFSEISAEAQISAQERNDVFKSAWFMLPEEHTKIVKALNGSLQNGPRTERKIRVMTTGILADAPDLLRIFDENNLQIVADDIAHESRQYRTDIPNDEQPLDALARKFADMDNCSVLYDPKKGRVDYIIDEAKKHRAQGVIVLMTKFCDPEEFDYVPIKGACDANNLPHINIEVDRQMVNYQQAGTMIQGFKEMF